MSTKKGVLIGCGIVIAASLILVVLIVSWIAYASQDLEGVTVSISAPLDVKVGETFTMVVNVKNERERKPLALSDVDISGAYLDGFVVLSTEPVPKSSMTVPVVNAMSYTFDSRIPAGKARSFTFTLRAEQPGLYRGDVDVCEGLRMITTTAQTVVKDK